MNPNTTFFPDTSTSHYGNFTNNSHTEIYKYVSIINGYVVPCLAIVVLITNAVVVLVFKRQKTYGASQAGLVGIAVSDTLTMLFPAPFYFYEFGLGNNIPCNCVELKYGISLYLPTITHTASIWLTVTLAGQRYLYICKPFAARSWCTLKNTTIIIVATYILAIFMHLSRFFVMEKVFLTDSKCEMLFRKTIDYKVYLSTYLIIRIILIQFVPCIVLIVLNTIMLFGLRDVTHKKIELQSKSENNHATSQENTRVTIIIICMAVITLLVELPVGIIQSLYVANYLTGSTVVPFEKLTHSELIVNVMIILSYPLNFFLYLSMSGEFKQTLKKLCLSIFQRKLEENRKMTKKTKHITTTVNGENTPNGKMKENATLLTCTNV